jgi:ribosomal protein L4
MQKNGTKHIIKILSNFTVNADSSIINYKHNDEANLRCDMKPIKQKRVFTQIAQENLHTVNR